MNIHRTKQTETRLVTENEANRTYPKKREQSYMRGILDEVGF